MANLGSNDIMSETQEETIARFQSITGWDDLQRCIEMLEAHQWKLEVIANSIRYLTKIFQEAAMIALSDGPELSSLPSHGPHITSQPEQEHPTTEANATKEERTDYAATSTSASSTVNSAQREGWWGWASRIFWSSLGTFLLTASTNLRRVCLPFCQLCSLL